MKKIIVIILTISLVLMIYMINKDNNVYYLSLGDSYALGMTPYGGYDYGYSDYIRDYLKDNGKLEKYISGFAKSGYRTIDLIRDIEDNKEIYVENEKISLKQALIKADLVTLSIGTNDILSMTSLKLDDMCINEAMDDMEILLKKIREYCKEKVIAIGYFNIEKNDISLFANKKYKELCDKYNIIYIDVSDLSQKYFPNPNDIHPSKDGYAKIFEKIKENLNYF